MSKNDDKKTEELLEEEQDSVIQEQIKPWHKRKFKKVLSVVGFSLLAGIIFGVAGRFVFKYSDSIISKIFGLNEPYDNVENRNPVMINNKTGDITPEAENGSVKINQKNEENIGTGNASDGTKTGDGQNTMVVNVEGYNEIIKSLRTTSDNVKKGIVRINAVTNIVNFLGESIEQTDSTMGIIVTESINDIYILTYYDKVKNADRIEISFGSGNNYLVSVTAYDEGYNVAVLSLLKQTIIPLDMENIAVLKIGNSNNLYPGMPVIGIGSLDGSNILTEYGYITGDTYTEYITDASIGLFTTDLGFKETGEGIVTDIDGNLVGVITRQLGGSLKFSANKCMKVNSLVNIAEILCNGGSRAYVGIVAENIPAWALKENNIEYGIYVNSVAPSSPAADAGIRNGDFIISVNGQEISDVDVFSDILIRAVENNEMNIELYRASKSTDPKFSVIVRPVNRNN